MSDLLTDDEHELIDMLGKCANLFGRVIGNGPTRAADTSEMVAPIHVLQQAVMSQAAARAYPTKYRLLGQTLRDDAKVESDPRAMWFVDAEIVRWQDLEPGDRIKLNEYAGSAETVVSLDGNVLVTDDCERHLPQALFVLREKP